MVETFNVTAWNLRERLGHPEDQRAIRDTLLQQAGKGAGLIVLSEVCREIPVPVDETHGYLADFSEAEGYELFWTEYADAERRTDQPPTLRQHLAVLSRMPAEGKVVRLGGRNAIALDVRYQDDNFHFMGSHFDDRTEDARIAQVYDFLSLTEQRPKILAGDLNNMPASSRNAIWLRKRPVKFILNNLPNKRWSSLGSRTTEMALGESLGLLVKSGLSDADPTQQPTVLALGKFPIAQLDHILYSDPFKSHGFMTGEPGPSDHRPISADFFI